MAMNVSFLTDLGKISGIAGVCVGVMLILFRDLLKTILLGKLSGDNSFRVVRLFMILVWSIAIVGLLTWRFAPSTFQDKTKDAQDLIAHFIDHDYVYIYTKLDDNLKRQLSPTGIENQVKVLREQVGAFIAVEPAKKHFIMETPFMCRCIKEARVMRAFLLDSTKMDL